MYFNRLGLLTHLRTDPADVKIRFARATPKLYSRFDVPKYPSPVDQYYEELTRLEDVAGLKRMHSDEQKFLRKLEKKELRKSKD